MYLLTITPFVVGIVYRVIDYYYNAKKKHAIDMALTAAKVALEEEKRKNGIKGHMK